MTSTEIKTPLSEYCLYLRGDTPSFDQKVQSPLNYCTAILEEAILILGLIESLEIEGSEIFLEKFTEHWENQIKEMIDAF